MSELRVERVSPWMVEIPRVGAMRVPGRVFVSKELMQTQKADEALKQVANVAELPGIVEAALAMPDFHWGYGFPIGGVAAFDPADGGVVSPGGIGYDINCLAGSTPVLFTDGYTRPIRELVVRTARRPVRAMALRDGTVSEGRVVAGLSRRPTGRVWELLTVSGRKIVATEEHPFMTPEGMRPLGELQVGDRIALLPFEGVPYRRLGRHVVVDEATLRRAARRIGKSDRGLGLTQALSALKPLLPLTLDHPAMPVLLKAAGLVLGDGAISFHHRTRRGVVIVNGLTEDLHALARDLRPWVRVSRVYSRRRRHRIDTAYGQRRFEAVETCVHIRSTGFALLLTAMGLPVGPKATQNWGVPPFLWRAPLWQQRLFLAGFFGAEMTTPCAFDERNRNFPCPILTVVKRRGWVESGEEFLRGVGRMLEGFGVRSLTVSRRDEQMNPDGRRSVRLRLLVSSTPDNLIALWGRVGFEYNRKRSRLGAQATAYLACKRIVLEARARLRERIVELRAASGWGAGRILQAVAGGVAPVNLRFVERTIYGRPDRSVRAPEVFPTFRQWRRGRTRGDWVWDEIAARVPRRGVRRVYDVTVDHPDHAFVAAGFVLHNCGVRLLRTDLTRNDVQTRVSALATGLFEAIPAGVGGSGAIPKLGREDLRRILVEGASWAIGRGFGRPEDLESIEDGGRLEGADPSAVSDRALSRGLPQVGTLGSGNHFLEVQVVDEVYRPEIAAKLGLSAGGVCIAIHSGSRGLGYQVCEDSLRPMVKAAADHGISLPDRQLCCAPLESGAARRYLGAMACAANYAWVNRQVMRGLVERVVERVFGRGCGMRLIYDVCHNIGKFEEHGGRRLFVHRKGATRAFPPGHPLLPERLRALGQPVFVPGDMGRASFLLIGAPGSMEKTWGSTCHGAGRAHSRTEMKRRTAGRDLFAEMRDRHGVVVMARGRDAVADEMPEAYKDAAQVVDVMERAGISEKVVRLRPIACIKG